MPYDTAMYLARVIGTVVCTVKYQGMAGIRFMLVERVDEKAQGLGDPHVAADATQSGVGEFVFCVGSREAALAFEESFIPVDAAIVGIVDAVEVSAPCD